MPPAPGVRQLEEACVGADVVVLVLPVVAQALLHPHAMLEFIFQKPSVKLLVWNFGSCSGYKLG